MSKKMSTQEILEDKDFQSLSGQKFAMSTILTILELVLYFGFIALIAFNKPFLSQKLSGAITIGIPIAVSISVGPTTHTMFSLKKSKKR